MNWALFGLFILGILLAIIGWLIDKAERFPRLLRIISSDYADGVSALDGLADNNRRALTSENPGFNILKKYWPELPDKGEVFLIGRSVAFTEFGPTVINDFELIAYDKDRNEVGNRWSDREARELLTSRFERRKFWFGTVIFYVGIAISLVAGIAEFLTSDA